MKRTLFFAAAIAMLAAPLPAYAGSNLLQLVCVGKTTSKNSNNRKFRKSFYVDVVAHTYCEDRCGNIGPVTARTQDTVSFDWAPDPEIVINHVSRQLTFNWVTKRMTGRVNLSIAYHEVYDIDAKCEVLQVDFIPVIKFFEDAQRASNAR